MRRRTDFPSLRSGLIVTGSTLALLMTPALAVAASSIDVLGAAAHTGAHGARVSVTPSDEAYVVDNTPSAEPRYVVRYYTNTSNLSIDPNDPNETLDQFIAFNAPVGGTEEFKVQLRQEGCQAQDVLPVDEPVDSDQEACSKIEASSTVSGNVTFRAGDSIELWSGFQASGSFTAEVSPTVKNGATFASVQVQTNSGNMLSSHEIPLTSGWNAIEVSWLAASSPGVNDGQIDLCVNGGPCLSSPLTHDHASQIDRVQWGAQAVGANTSGHMDLDDFDSRRAGPIGPVQ